MFTLLFFFELPCKDQSKIVIIECSHFCLLPPKLIIASINLSFSGWCYQESLSGRDAHLFLKVN